MKKGFTLIELLAVVAIVAILAVVVVLIINPTELLRQGRDATRVSDIGTINKAVALYYQDAMNNPSTLFMGTSSVIYVSVPDPTTTSTNQCQGLGLPTAPAGYTYQCAGPSNYMKNNGTGWIPINFTSYSAGSVISKIPADPVNTTSTNLYYTYETDGIGGYKITSFFESQKYMSQMASGGSDDPDLYEKGTNLALPTARGLMGYWNFDEGAGSSTIDISGGGGNGTWSGTQVGTSGYYSPGKVGPWAGTFDGNSTDIAIPADASLQTVSSTGSIAAWINYSTSTTGETAIMDLGGTGSNGLILLAGQTSNIPALGFGAVAGNQQLSSGVVLPSGTWYFVTATWASTGGKIYINGVLENSDSAVPSILLNATTMYIGSNMGTRYYMPGMIDDLRVYNYALSAAQVQALYALER